MGIGFRELRNLASTAALQYQQPMNLQVLPFRLVHLHEKSQLGKYLGFREV